MKKFISEHFYFGWHWTSVLALIIALLVYPAIQYLPKTWGYENGILENAQMIILLIGFILALKSKYHKQFFNFAALIITIIALREINCGRTIFFPIPGTVNQFYKWKDIPYGYLAHPLYGLYIAWVAIYFLKNKCYIPLKNMLTKIPLPVWNIAMMFLGIGLGEYAENCTHCFVFEEMGELLFYVSLVGIIYLYTIKDKFVLKENID